MNCNLDVILIDDDQLVRMSWELSARRAGVSFVAYSSLDEFRKQMPNLSRETKIYLDSDLSEGQRGEDAVPELVTAGFKKIFLATGYQPEDFTHIKGLSGVVGKRAPFSISLS